MRRFQRNGQRRWREPESTTAETLKDESGPALDYPDAGKGKADTPEQATPEHPNPGDPRATGSVPGSLTEHEGDVHAPVFQTRLDDGSQERVAATSFGELARAYVPVQMYGRILPPEEGFHRGTIFGELVRTPPLYQRLD